METCDCSWLCPTATAILIAIWTIKWFYEPRRTKNKLLTEVPPQNKLLTEVPPPQLVRRINDELYEIYVSGNDDFEVIVIFFHGIIRCRDLDGDGDGDIHVSTWITNDEDTKSEVLWPRVWLGEEFPKSRIYTVKYDASIKATATDGRCSLRVLAENMMQDIILKFPPEFWTRPVVLVGHSFGGIVIKKFLHLAQEQSDVRDPRQKTTISKFLDSVKLIFYYSTPHHGMDITIAKRHVSLQRGIWSSNEMIEEYAKQLNADLAILDGDFSNIARKYGWLEAGVAELNYTRWDSIKFDGLVVSEASSRHRIHQHYYSVHEDHFSITRPKSRTAGSFQYLVRYMRDILPLESDTKLRDMRNILPLQSDIVDIPNPTRLNPSQILRAGDSRRSSNGVYRLVMQKDNRLVLYGRDRLVIWSSFNTPTHLPNCYCVMQVDGDLVIRAVQRGDDGQTVLWSTKTNGPEDASRFIEVQNDGNAVMWNERGRAVWATQTSDADRSWIAGARLLSGQVLNRGEFLMSPIDGYKLIMQEDCNLALYGGDFRPIWSSNTSKVEYLRFCHFIMQTDGNAVLYAGNSAPLTVLWSTKTAGNHYIEVQDDGNTVMYAENRREVWCTHTKRGPLCRDQVSSGQIMYSGDSRLSLNRRYRLLMQWDGVLVLYKKDEGRIWASGSPCQTYQESALSGGTLNCYFIMKPNGSAEIYTGNKMPAWSVSPTGPNHGKYGTYHIEVQNDGNVVMYDKGFSRQQLWATNTAKTS